MAENRREHRYKPAVWFPAIRCGSGADVFTERLCQALNCCGIRAEITWLPHRAEYAPWTVKIPTPPDWANVVHINSWLPPRFVPGYLPILVTIHGCVHDMALMPYKSRLQRLYHRFWIFPIEAANLQRATKRVAVSHYTARIAKKAFGLTDIDVIHNGIDCNRLIPLPRAAPHRPFRLLYVGNWSMRKGVNLLAPIMERLGEKFELYYTADCKRRHEHYNLPENCFNLGRLSGETLVRAYQEADALLFPTRLEGFGLAAVEAMACGLAVITTNCSALPEVIEDGVTGFLCPQDDVEAFAARARQLASASALWLGMREQARKRAVALFSEQKMLERYITLYQNLIDEPTDHRPHP